MLNTTRCRVQGRLKEAGEGAAHGRNKCLHQETLAELSETDPLRRGGETGTEQAPEAQGETKLRREAEEPEEQAVPAEKPELRRDGENQAGEG